MAPRVQIPASLAAVMGGVVAPLVSPSSCNVKPELLKIPTYLPWVWYCTKFVHSAHSMQYAPSARHSPSFPSQSLSQVSRPSIAATLPLPLRSPPKQINAKLFPQESQHNTKSVNSTCTHVTCVVPHKQFCPQTLVDRCTQHNKFHDIHYNMWCFWQHNTRTQT